VALAALVAACDVGDAILTEADADAGAGTDLANAGAEDASLPPPETWIRHILPAGADILRGYGTDLIEAADGGFVVAGWAMVDWPSGDGRTWLARLDAAGGILWDELVGGDSVEWAAAVAPHPGGGFVAAGASWTVGSGGPAFLRFDDEGNPLWQRTWLDGDAGGAVRALVPFEDGFVASGWAGRSSTSGYAWFGRLDAEGRPLWRKRLSAAGSADRDTVQATSDGNMIVAAGLGPDGAGGTWVAKLDADSAILWQRRAATSATSLSEGPTVHETVGGDIVVTTMSRGLVVLRFAPDGAFHWGIRVGECDRRIGGRATDGPDGGLVIAGMDESSGDRDLWLFGLSAAGALLWQHTIRADGLDYAVAAIRTSDGAVAALSGGCCGSTLAKVRADGTLDDSCGAWTGSSTTFTDAGVAVAEADSTLEDLPVTVVDGTPTVDRSASTVTTICP
jgi:hypothetical protein